MLLNLVGTITLFVIDGPTSFMNTPVKAEGISPMEFLATASLWDKIYNHSRMPDESAPAGRQRDVRRVHHRPCGCLYVHGGEEEDERAYYDWMGFVGNLIGVGALFLPFMGYLLAYELCDYDASICPI